MFLILGCTEISLKFRSSAGSFFFSPKRHPPSRIISFFPVAVVVVVVVVVVAVVVVVVAVDDRFMAVFPKIRGNPTNKCVRRKWHHFRKISLAKK